MKASTDYDRQSNWNFLALNCEFNAGKLAEKDGISLRHLERLFQKEFGRKPKDWLIEQRMITARYLLFEGKTIREVSTILEYRSVHHFAKVFKQIYGIPPKEFVSRFAPSSRIKS